MIPPITGLYIGLSALLMLTLAALVVRQRLAHNVFLGDGDGAVEPLRRAGRAFGNTAEYIPILLLLLAAIESAGAPAWVAHLFGAAIVISRLGLAVALSSGNGRLRQISMLTTFVILAFGGLGVIGHSMIGGGG
ncbi:MAG: MAPEG family protein [Pseudomonadota bacterium]